MFEIIAQYTKKNGKIGPVVQKEEGRYYVTIGECGSEVDKDFALRLADLIRGMNLVNSV